MNTPYHAWFLLNFKAKLLVFCTLFAVFYSIHTDIAFAQTPPQEPFFIAQNSDENSDQEVNYNARVALIDLVYIEKNSEKFQEFLPKLKSVQEQFQNEISQREASVNRFRTETEAQRSILSAEAYSQRFNDLNGQVEELRQLIQQRSRIIDGLLNDARSIMIKNVTKVTVEIMQERSIDLVVNVGGVSSSVFTYANRLRIDAAVVEKLNQEEFDIDIDALRKQQESQLETIPR